MLVACCDAFGQTSTDPLRASVSLASDTVHNGVLQTTSGPAVRLAFDYQHDSGFFGGGSLANVEYLFETGFEKSRDIQQTLYAGYVWRNSQWTSAVTVSRYLFPDIERNYDYTQASVSVSYRDRFFVTASHSQDYLDVYEQMKQIRVGVALPWIWNLEFGLNAGRLEYAGRFATEYSHWDIGLSRPVGRFALDLRFHDSTADRISLGGNPTQNEWVFSMTYALLPLQRSQDRR